jgi:mercuric reductase
MEQERFDLIVIGSGGAGREAARLAAGEHGARVAVVERLRWGGECGSVACKPTKQYVAAAELLYDLRAVGRDLGLGVDRPAFDLAALKARKDWLVGSPDRWRARFDLPGLTAVDGDARIVDAGTVVVGGRVLETERILVATGSRTAVPPIEGIDGVRWLDNVAALELTEVPESLLVVGGGAVGLEFGQVFARFGARVTLVEAGDAIGGRADRELADALRAALEAEGMTIHTATFVASVRPSAGGITATLTSRNGGEPRDVEAVELLLAAGRVPNVEGMGLEEVGVEVVQQGIVVDARQRTRVDGIWAAGDVVAGIQLTPVAAYQGQVAVADMFGAQAREAVFGYVPSAIFTDPELAGVGLTEAQAVDAGFVVETSTYPAAGLIRPYYTLPRGAEAHGAVKLVFERGSRRLLGVHAAIRGGAELVQGFAVALALGATVDDVAFGHYAFPTSAEAVHYAAEAALAGELVGA